MSGEAGCFFRDQKRRIGKKDDRRNQFSLPVLNNNKKLCRREANEGAPLQTLDVLNIINFACHYVVLDFVLVYEENDDEETPREVSRFRRRYMNNLQKSQLEFEEVSFLKNMLLRK